VRRENDVLVRELRAPDLRDDVELGYLAQILRSGVHPDTGRLAPVGHPEEQPVVLAGKIHGGDAPGACIEHLVDSPSTGPAGRQDARGARVLQGAYTGSPATRYRAHAIPVLPRSGRSQRIDALHRLRSRKALQLLGRPTHRFRRRCQHELAGDRLQPLRKRFH